ncbi:MAG: hypothetical protein J3K34DRAFT_490834 [Monoraphidium minutum]|nr:MAG: hypothetical protein J3K34DRAFT_490834 [Monoraphidium minutum]
MPPRLVGLQLIVDPDLCGGGGGVEERLVSALASPWLRALEVRVLDRHALTAPANAPEGPRGQRALAAALPQLTALTRLSAQYDHRGAALPLGACTGLRELWLGAAPGTAATHLVGVLSRHGARLSHLTKLELACGEDDDEPTSELPGAAFAALAAACPRLADLKLRGPRLIGPDAPPGAAAAAQLTRLELASWGSGDIAGLCLKRAAPALRVLVVVEQWQAAASSADGHPTLEELVVKGMGDGDWGSNVNFEWASHAAPRVTALERPPPRVAFRVNHHVLDRCTRDGGIGEDEDVDEEEALRLRDEWREAVLCFPASWICVRRLEQALGGLYEPLFNVLPQLAGMRGNGPLEELTLAGCVAWTQADAGRVLWCLPMFRNLEALTLALVPRPRWHTFNLGDAVVAALLAPLGPLRAAAPAAGRALPALTLTLPAQARATGAACAALMAAHPGLTIEVV